MKPLLAVAIVLAVAVELCLAPDHHARTHTAMNLGGGLSAIVQIAPALTARSGVIR